VRQLIGLCIKHILYETIFCTNMQIITACKEQFVFILTSDLIANRALFELIETIICMFSLLLIGLDYNMHFAVTYSMFGNADIFSHFFSLVAF